jgi:uncharacterized phiE125 gp8 family phage protein
MIYTIVSNPSVEPLTLAEVKLHLKQDFDEDDALISALIKAARLSAENYCDTSFIQTSYKLTLDDFSDLIKLERGKVIGTPVVKYYENGTLVTVPTSDYRVIPTRYGAMIEPVTSWNVPDERTDAVTIEFNVGFGTTADDVPSDIKAAMKLIIGYLYENREDTVKSLPSASEYLLKPYKVFSTC